MSKLRPLCNKLVVRRLKNESVTTSGIILSQSSLELSNKGEVLAVGVEVVDIKEQDIVLFNNDQTVQIVKVNNEEFLIIKDSDNLVIVENELGIYYEIT